MARSTDYTKYDDDTLQSIIRSQSDFVVSATEKLHRKMEDVAEAQIVLKQEERLYDAAVAEAERRRNQ